MKNCVLELIAARNFQRIRWKEALSSVRERFFGFRSEEQEARSKKREARSSAAGIRNRQCTVQGNIPKGYKKSARSS
jgi:hypothetical protein